LTSITTWAIKKEAFLFKASSYKSVRKMGLEPTRLQ
jgi:hypothetical protein